MEAFDDVGLEGFPLFLLILPLDEEEVVGDVRGDAGFLVLNPL